MPFAHCLPFESTSINWMLNPVSSLFLLDFNLSCSALVSSGSSKVHENFFLPILSAFKMIFLGFSALIFLVSVTL